MSLAQTKVRSMDEVVADAGIWSRLSTEDIGLLRQAVRRVLLRNGVPRELCTDRECDKWIESRYESTLVSLIRQQKDNG